MRPGRDMYDEAKAEARRAVRKAKNDDWVQLGRELGREAAGNQQSFWQRVNAVRKVKGGSVQTNGKDGKLLTDQTEVIHHWREHFEGLFEEEEERIQQWRLELSEDNDVGISEDEVRRAVSRLKGGKAAGMCGIRPEALKGKLEEDEGDESGKKEERMSSDGGRAAVGGSG